MRNFVFLFTSYFKLSSSLILELMSFEKEQTAAIEACLRAAKLCERVRSAIPKAIEKQDQSPVTVRFFS